MSVTEGSDWNPDGLQPLSHRASYQFMNLWLVLCYMDHDFCFEIPNEDTLYIENIERDCLPICTGKLVLNRLIVIIYNTISRKRGRTIYVALMPSHKHCIALQ